MFFTNVFQTIQIIQINTNVNDMIESQRENSFDRSPVQIKKVAITLLMNLRIGLLNFRLRKLNNERPKNNISTRPFWNGSYILGNWNTPKWIVFLHFQIIIKDGLFWLDIVWGELKIIGLMLRKNPLFNLIEFFLKATFSRRLRLFFFWEKFNS